MLLGQLSESSNMYTPLVDLGEGGSRGHGPHPAPIKTYNLDTNMPY